MGKKVQIVDKSWMSCRSFLKTVDQRNLSNGAAEMLKMACIKDAELFYMLEEYADHFVTDKFQVCCPAH